MRCTAHHLCHLRCEYSILEFWITTTTTTKPWETASFRALELDQVFQTNIEDWFLARVHRYVAKVVLAVMCER